MKAIDLSKRRHALVDDDVWDWLHYWKWYANHGFGNCWYARRKVHNPSSHTTLYVYLHRLVAGTPKGCRVIFKDANALNVQRENLSFLDYDRNELAWPGSKAKSAFTGVVWDGYYGLWRAHLKGLVIGHYEAEVEGAQAYNEAAQKILGDSAELNDLELAWRRK